MVDSSAGATLPLWMYVAGWYFSAITLSLYNKWMFDPAKGLHVPYPILVTTFHQVTLYAAAYLYIKVRGLQDDSRNNVRKQDGSINWKYYLVFLIPTAVATAGDIAFGNVSFKFVPLTIYTIVKSSSIAFVLLFGCILKLEQFHWKLVAIIVIMFSGITLMVYSPHSLNSSDKTASTILFGTILVLISASLSGFRWVLIQKILIRSADNNEKQQPRPHPIHTIYRLTPIMGVVLFITSLIIEKPFPGVFELRLFRSAKQLDDTDSVEYIVTTLSVIKGLVLLIIPGLEVLLLTICEFSILQLAHVLTLSVAGIAKEVLTILLGMLIFGERVNGILGWLGMAIVLGDVAYYNYFRYIQKKGAGTSTESEEGFLSSSDETSDNGLEMDDLNVIEIDTNVKA